MHKTKEILFLLLGIMFSVSSISFSQPPRGSFIISPQVHADKTITFRYLPHDNFQELFK